MTRQRVGLITAGVLLVGWLLLPSTDVVTPDWDVLVTDQNSRPVPETKVIVFSQQYTLERSDLETEKLTDAAGHVHFDRRDISANQFTRLVGFVRGLNQGVHASYGVHTHLSAFKEGYGEPSDLTSFGSNERNENANGSPHQDSHIVIVACRQGSSGFGCDLPSEPLLFVPSTLTGNRKNQ